MLKLIARSLFKLAVALAHRSYGIEGVNGLLLILPAKLIVPTLRRYGATIGEGVTLHSPLIIHNAHPVHGYRNLEIGDHCYFARDVFLDLTEKIRLAEHVVIGMRSTILTHVDLGDNPLSAKLPAARGPVVFEENVYVAAAVTVLHGVRVGANSVVGAASLLRSDVPPGSLAAGVPARVIRPL